MISAFFAKTAVSRAAVLVIRLSIRPQSATGTRVSETDNSPAPDASDPLIVQKLQELSFENRPETAREVLVEVQVR